MVRAQDGSSINLIRTKKIFGGVAQMVRAQDGSSINLIRSEQKNIWRGSSDG
jgi:hypothetical protein